MATWLWILVGLLAVAGLFVLVQYNKLVSLRLRIQESWANVDTELKRRHDLIPNLVETVKGYARHERAVLGEVTRLRAEARQQRSDTHHRFEVERSLAAAMGRLLAVAEAYPVLRASQNFLHLQRQLVDTEDRIQAARRFYNGNVRDYNNQVQQFPSNLVARSFRFEAHEYFELPSVAERAAPMVAI
jgi:LemA protein